MSAAPAISVAEAIRRHDGGRDPGRPAPQLAKTKRRPRVFPRGACRMFDDAPPALTEAPLAWRCGDAP